MPIRFETLAVHGGQHPDPTTLSRENLYSIPGTPPNLFADVKGDAFAPRNPYALKIDFVERPPYFEVSPTHKARTWLLDPRAPKVEPPENIRNLRSVQEGNV